VIEEGRPVSFTGVSEVKDIELSVDIVCPLVSEYLPLVSR
jgi:hypothetical protein